MISGTTRVCDSLNQYALNSRNRPDYQKLHRLRQMLPSVPIMALSATCPPLVLKDLLKTLSLPDIVDGRSMLYILGISVRIE